MSKMKLSFSLILTLILVGILSTSVFARGAYWGGLSPDGTGGYTFKFINTSEDPTKDFTVKVYSNEDNYASLKTTSTTLTDVPNYPEPTGAAGEYRTITISGTDYAFKVGTIYKFVLSDGTNDAAVQFGVLTTHDNLNMASIADSPTGVTVDVDGSKLYNANHTGAPGAAKKGGNTHGFYQNNTNSCAGCHQTHTAANGEYLLFKDGIYSTCSACHDGTTGAYNAFAQANAETPWEIAGTFDVNNSDKSLHNGSLHQADGSLKVSAAPGGNATPTAEGTVGSVFSADFDCASCHAPHGSGSTAENNLNMDPLGWSGIAYATSNNDAKNGKLFKNAVIWDYAANGNKLPATMSQPYILVKKVATAADVTPDAINPLKTYAGLYKRAGVQEGDLILQTYRWTGSKYDRDFSVWMRSSDHVSAPFEVGTTFFNNSSSTDITGDLNIVWKDGFAYGANVANVASAQFALGIDVETTTDIKSLYDSTSTNYIFDSGMEMSKYCASCHTDYLSNVRKNLTGTYTQAHRHTTGSDRLTCVRCHFGHGTDAKIMKDANDESFFDKTKAVVDGGKGMTENAALTYLVDPNPSSALKRYTGMAVCYACHGDGSQFINNPNMNHIDPTAVDPVYGSHSVGPVAGDALKGGDPGTDRQ